MNHNLPEWNHRQPNTRYLTYGLITLLLILLGATVLLGSVPPVSRDALTHHLFVPELYLHHGGIYKIPEIVFSYYPMNLDLLYMIPLWFGNDIAPKYIHYFFALLTAWFIYCYLKTRLSTDFGLLGAVFFLSIPIIVKLSITAYVDLGLVFFSTASLLLLFRWAETGFQKKYLIFSGLCCGLAAGTKYNGLLTVFILTLFVPLLYQQTVTKDKQSNSKALFYGMLFAAITLFAFSPWLVRNYIWTGNPIYPLHNSLFQHNRPVEHNTHIFENDDDLAYHSASHRKNIFVNRKILYHETWRQTLLLPIRFFYQGQDDNPQYFDGKLTPFLLLLPILSFFFKPRDSRERREKRYLLLFSTLYFLLAFFQASMRIRYVVPIVPPLAILSIFGLKEISCLFSRAGRKVTFLKWINPLGMVVIIFLLLGYNAKYIFSQFQEVTPMAYLKGTISRDAYITRFRPEYPAIQFANKHLKADSKVLCIFLGNRGYYMDFHPVFEPRSGIEVLKNYLNKDICGETLIQDINKKGIHYALLRNDLTAWWFSKLNANQKKCFTPLLEQANTPLFNKNGYTFFKIKNSDHH
jgi:Dolichyl-phosphate-mannose-protein mannosyltransferase